MDGDPHQKTDTVMDPEMPARSAMHHPPVELEEHGGTINYQITRMPCMGSTGQSKNSIHIYWTVYFLLGVLLFGVW